MEITESLRVSFDEINSTIKMLKEQFDFKDRKILDYINILEECCRLLKVILEDM